MKRLNRILVIFSICLIIVVLLIWKQRGNEVMAAIREKLGREETRIDNSDSYATSHTELEIPKLAEETIEEENIQETDYGEERNMGIREPITDEIIKIHDLYTENDTEVTMRCFYPGASYIWEKYNLQTKDWEIMESNMGTDELFREISLCTVYCEKSISPIMVRCTAVTEEQEYTDVAAIHILDKEISSLALSPYIANAGDYLSAKDIPVKVTFSDGSAEEISGLYGLYWIQEEEKTEYSQSISGNMVETVTTVLTALEYQYIELGEMEEVMRYRIGDHKQDIPITIEGKDLTKPDILKVELGSYEISNIDEPIPIQVTITAVDNHTPYTDLSYCFLPSGKEPEEKDWQKESAWEAMIDKNGIWVAYVKDTAGNIATTEKEIIAVDQKAPVMKITLENTEWCEETKIMVEATDNLDIMYCFSCPATGENSGWIEAAEYAVNRNGVWVVAAKDSLGNTAEKEIEITNIDRQLPVIHRITVQE